MKISKVFLTTSPKTIAYIKAVCKVDKATVKPHKGGLYCHDMSEPACRQITRYITAGNQIHKKNAEQVGSLFQEQTA